MNPDRHKKIMIVNSLLVLAIYATDLFDITGFILSLFLLLIPLSITLMSIDRSPMTVVKAALGKKKDLDEKIVGLCRLSLASIGMIGLAMVMSNGENSDGISFETFNIAAIGKQDGADTGIVVTKQNPEVAAAKKEFEASLDKLTEDVDEAREFLDNWNSDVQSDVSAMELQIVSMFSESYATASDAERIKALKELEDAEPGEYVEFYEAMIKQEKDPVIYKMIVRQIEGQLDTQLDSELYELDNKDALVKLVRSKSDNGER